MNRSQRRRQPPDPRRRPLFRLLFGWSLLVILSSVIFILPALYLSEFLVGSLIQVPAVITRILGPAFWLLIIFLLCRLVGALVHRRLVNSREPLRRNPFEDAMDALDSIASGDFDVLLEEGSSPYHYYNTLAEKINELAKGLGATERMRQDFVSNVSHEIQSPLTSIGGFAALLRQDDLDPETRNYYLEIIEAETTRLSKLSENLLRLSALDAESQPVGHETYRLDKQIESILLLLEPQWSEKNLEMEVNLDQVEITGDEDLLSQVWINLIHNSVKFTPEGGRLTLSLEERDKSCVFTLTDTGIGMSEETVDRIFERFYKADEARMRAKGGNGLGLSIVKKIIGLHDGEIAVESREGEGSTFTVTLPKGEKK